MEKVYVVVRADLPPGAQIAQACHALSAYAADFPEAHADWHRAGQNLVVLQAPDEEALSAILLGPALRDVVRSAWFREPDLAGQLTACAFSGDAERALSSLPLALRKPRCPKCKALLKGQSCSGCRARISADCQDCA